MAVQSWNVQWAATIATVSRSARLHLWAFYTNMRRMNETTNETAAKRATDSGELERRYLAGPDARQGCRKAGRVASRRQSASGLCRGTGITLGDRDVREERAPSRLHAPSRRSAWQRRGLPNGQICVSGIGLATTQRRPTSLGCRDGGGISRLAWGAGQPAADRRCHSRRRKSQLGT